MFKFLIFLAYIGLIFIQSEPAYCQSSRTETFQLSVTMPEHIMANNLGGALFSNNPNQLVQTQTVIRNNKTILLTSIVVP